MKENKLVETSQTCEATPPKDRPRAGDQGCFGTVIVFAIIISARLHADAASRVKVIKGAESGLCV